MKLNDVRVLKNILGDGIDSDDHDEFLTRKIPRHELKKLSIGKLPKKDMYGRNLEVNPNTNEITSTKEGDITYSHNVETSNVQPYTSVNTDKPVESKKSYVHEPSQEVKDLRNKAQLLEAQAIIHALTPKQSEPASKLVSFGVPGTGGKYKFEVRRPTSHGFYKGLDQFRTQIATPLTRNLGYSAGGGVVGEFASETGGKRLQGAISAKQQYLSYLAQKHVKRGYTIRGEGDILNLASEGERKKIAQLNQAINSAQVLASSTGFLSGSGGKGIMQAARRQSTSTNIPRMTQIGNVSGSYGSFAPEAFSRMNIGQGLTAVTPVNKWESLLGGKSTDNDKVTRLLGKTPDPTGKTPSEKISGYTKMNYKKFF